MNRRDFQIAVALAGVPEPGLSGEGSGVYSKEGTALYSV